MKMDFKNVKQAVEQLRFVPLSMRKDKDFSTFDRDIPPMRGFARKLETWDEIFSTIRSLKANFQNWMSEKIKSFPVEVRDSIIEWEAFQEKQKGPTAPLLGQSGFNQLIDDLVNYNRSYEIKDDYLNTFKVAQDLLKWRFFSHFDKISIKDINYKEALYELPRGTVRGGPFYGKGRDKDDEIVSVLGSSPNSVIESFNSTDFILCVSGYRISGSPYLNEAKFRLVFIPDMFYQYFMNGITKKMMKYLKQFPSFCGWLNPVDRQKVLNDQYLKAKSQGLTLIQLDYSAYDKHIHPKLQELTTQFFSSMFYDWDLVNASMLSKLSNQRILFFDKAGRSKFYTINNQLISGKSDTQLTGSLIGLTLTLSFLITKFGIDKAKTLIDYLFQLGDDTLFPYVLSDQQDYEKLLLEYSEFVSHYGFSLNPKKAYPNSDAAFLQKLIRPDIGLDSIGTWQRSLMSFMFSEKFKVNKFGSTIALDIISQISILENAYGYGKFNLNDYYYVFVQDWINMDNALFNLLCYLKSKKKLDGNSIFLSLVNLAGIKSDSELLKAMDLLSYDHTGLSEKLNSDKPDYGSIFHAIQALSDILYKQPEKFTKTVSFKDLINEFKAEPSIQEEDLSREIVEE